MVLKAAGRQVQFGWEARHWHSRQLSMHCSLAQYAACSALPPTFSK